MKTLQMAMPDPADFCTVAYAAETIGCSQRYVRELIKPGGPLNFVSPRKGSRETGRWLKMLFVTEVQEYARAYKLTKQRATVDA
jgi:hypothetical protein